MPTRWVDNMGAQAVGREVGTPREKLSCHRSAPKWPLQSLMCSPRLIVPSIVSSHAQIIAESIERRALTNAGKISGTPEVTWLRLKWPLASHSKGQDCLIAINGAPLSHSLGNNSVGQATQCVERKVHPENPSCR